jgi:hypothetical protein
MTMMMTAKLLGTFDLGLVDCCTHHFLSIHEGRKRRAKVTPGREHPLQGASGPSYVDLLAFQLSIRWWRLLGNIGSLNELRSLLLLVQVTKVYEASLLLG